MDAARGRPAAPPAVFVPPAGGGVGLLCRRSPPPPAPSTAAVRSAAGARRRAAAGVARRGRGRGGGACRLRAAASPPDGGRNAGGDGGGGAGGGAGAGARGGGLPGFVPAPPDARAAASDFVPAASAADGGDASAAPLPPGQGAGDGDKLNINRAYAARDLSGVPREYQARVRARLGGSRANAGGGGTGGGGGGGGGGAADALRAADALEAHDELPDDLDAMDDLVMDRGADNAGRVLMFGGWLDEAVAGRKAGKVDTPLASSADPTAPDAEAAAAAAGASPSAAPTLPGFARASAPDVPALTAADGTALDALAVSRVPETARLALTEEALAALAGELFGRGLSAFNVGSYASAGELLSGACRLSSPRTRAGGQYRLWWAQALDAAGKREGAREVLGHLATHPSGDVRKVAEEILYILSAPRLDLDASHFVAIPTLDGWEETRRRRRPFRGVKTAAVDAAPEPYTLEWYMEKAAPPPPPADGGGETMLLWGVAAGLAAVTAAALIH